MSRRASPSSLRRMFGDWIRGRLAPRVLVSRGLQLGENVFIGDGVYIDPGFCWLVSIGDDTTITEHATILTHDGSTKRALGYTRLGRVTIGRGVFIGARSVILPGVTIGDGAIVGAGSVVRRDVPANALVVGNPAQVVREVEQYLEQQREVMARRPRYPRSGWTLAGGISEAHKRQQWEDLADGPGFVE